MKPLYILKTDKEKKETLPIFIRRLEKTEHFTDDSTRDNQNTLKIMSIKPGKEIDGNSKKKRKRKYNISDY